MGTGRVAVAESDLLLELEFDSFTAFESAVILQREWAEMRTSKFLISCVCEQHLANTPDYARCAGNIASFGIWA